MKNLIKVLMVNLVVSLFLFEVGGQILKARDRSINPSENSIKWNKLYTDYLRYVNHIRDFDYRNKGNDFKFSIKPSNYNDDTLFIYSCYGDICNSSVKSFDLLIQGDSWAEGFDRNILSIQKYMKKRSNIISAGTTSFSPSNMEGQLGYFRQNGMTFKLIIAIIDQTDIGDEFFRYKDNTIPADSKNLFSKVKAFGPSEHTHFYNYSTKPDAHMFGTSYVYNRLLRKVNSGNTPSYSLISSPLRGELPSANGYFKQRLKSYINYALNGNKKSQLLILTHDHKQHLSGAYSISTQQLVEDVLKTNFDKSKRVKHVHINPLRQKLCTSENCSDYFIKNDIASHPNLDSYKKIISKLSSRLMTIQ